MDNVKNKMKYILSLLLLVVVFMGFAQEKVEAKTALPNWNRVEVVDKYTTIDDKFTFIPKFKSNSHLTVGGGGSTWRRTNWSSDDNRKFQTFNINEGRNGSLNNTSSVIARYRNVGKYNGQEMDLRIVLRGWKLNSKASNGGNISFEENRIAMSSTGFDWVDMEWQFYRAGSSGDAGRVPVNGYFTISDIDLRQGVDIHGTTFNSIDNVYVENASNQLWRQLVGNWNRISTDFAGDVDDNIYKPDYAFTFTFSNSRLNFRWITDWSKRPSSGALAPRYKSTNSASGEYFMYTNIKPARFAVVPKKKVNYSSMSHPKDTKKRIDYDVTFKVPEETRGTYYTDFLLTDTIDPMLKVGDISFYDDKTGEQVNSFFNVKRSGNKISVYNSSHDNTGGAKDWRLRQASFYDRDYRMRIRATVDTDKLESKFESQRSYTAKNRAFLTINGVNQEKSNQVTTEIRDEPIDIPDPDPDPDPDPGPWPDPGPRPNPDPGDGEEEPIMYNLRVEHIDEASGRLITSSSSSMEEGSYYSASSRSDLRKGHNRYVFVRGTPRNSSTQSGTLTSSRTIRFYYRAQYTLTVRHVDEHSQSLLESSSSKFLEGESYIEYSNSGYRDGRYHYKQLNPLSKRGTMTRDTTITFYYRVPEVQISNDGIHIYTDRAGSQPADVFVRSGIKAPGNGHGQGPTDTIDEFAGGSVRLKVIDTDRNIEVWRKQMSIKDLYSKAGQDIYNGYHAKLDSLGDSGDKINYKYEIEVISEGYNGYRITSNQVTNTHGYIASDKIIKGNQQNQKFEWDGVMLTESEPYRGVKEYYEEITINKMAGPRLKSGYGYEFEPVVEYRMETTNNADVRVRQRLRGVGRDIETDSKPLMNFDRKIVDLSDKYIDDKGKDGKVPVNFDSKSYNTGTSSKWRVWNRSYHLPKGYLSRVDGRIRYGDYSSNKDYVDAGNKMYVPIWIKGLGDYDAEFKQNVKIGANRVGFTLDNNVEVYAYMLSHTDSETPEDELDELLLHPMNKDDSLFNWAP